MKGKMDKLRKTANHLKLLRYAESHFKKEEYSHMQLIMASSIRWYSYQDIKNHIQFCKKKLQERLKKCI